MENKLNKNGNEIETLVWYIQNANSLEEALEHTTLFIISHDKKIYKRFIEAEIEKLHGIKRQACCDCTPEANYRCFHQGQESAFTMLVSLLEQQLKKLNNK